jgi:hypothetical protein
LTVVAHELGHIVGLDDMVSSSGGLMARKLQPGVRRSITEAAIDELFGELGGRVDKKR